MTRTQATLAVVKLCPGKFLSTLKVVAKIKPRLTLQCQVQPKLKCTNIAADRADNVGGPLHNNDMAGSILGTPRGHVLRAVLVTPD